MIFWREDPIMEYEVREAWDRLNTSIENSYGTKNNILYEEIEEDLKILNIVVNTVTKKGGNDV